jgi:hypothetical protein
MVPTIKNTWILVSLWSGLWTGAVSAAASRTYTLYHDTTGNGTFTKRSTVTLAVESPDNVGEKPELVSRIENVEDCFGEWVDGLISDGSFYRLKLVDDSSGASTLTSVFACSLRRAHFRERLELSVDPTGDLISLSYTPLISPLAPSCEDVAPLETILSHKTPEEAKDFFLPKSQVSLERALNAISVPLVLPQTRPPPGTHMFQLSCYVLVAASLYNMFVLGSV